MKTDSNNDLDSLFDNNKEIIDKLMEEKRLLENIFLDNRTPKDFKEELLAPYNALSEMIDKRLEVNSIIMNSKEDLDIIGILYNERQGRYLHSVIRNLQDIAGRKNLNILWFTIDNLDIHHGFVTGTLISDSIIKESTLTIPKFIYNLGYYTKPSNKNKIKQLNIQYGSVVVNPLNVFNQAVVYDILSSLSYSKEFILPFSTLTPSSLERYLDYSSSIFLIPESGTVRGTAISIERTLRGRRTLYIMDTGSHHFEFEGEDAFQEIKEVLGNKQYMIILGRKTISWNDSPLIASVYIQRDITGKWNITDMIAKNDMFQRDSAESEITDDLSQVLTDSVPDGSDEVIQRLANYSKNICVYLDYYFANLGSCTLDFIFDNWGLPYLVYFGGWDQRSYLFGLNYDNNWIKYISNAIDYLIYLKSVDERKG